MLKIAAALQPYCLLAALLSQAILPEIAEAAGVERLRDYFKKSQSMRASFHQTVEDKQLRKIQDVDGQMQLQRPGKFRWDYQKPYQQQIVGDGERIWLYDEDLNQVTIRDLRKSIGNSPASLLAGDAEIEQHFVLKNTSRKGNLEWVMATAKNRDAEFERLFFGFSGLELREMELHDSFGNRTRIVFRDVEINPLLRPESFLFKPPAGADVVGE